MQIKSDGTTPVDSHAGKLVVEPTHKFHVAVHFISPATIVAVFVKPGTEPAAAGLGGNLRHLNLEGFNRDLLLGKFGLGRHRLDETFGGSILEELGRHLHVILWKKVVGGSRECNEASDSDERPRFHGN